MSDEEKGSIQTTLQSLQRFAGSQIVIVIMVTFGAGAWATNIHNSTNRIESELAALRNQLAEEHVTTTARIVEWAAWRKSVDAALDLRLQDRFTATDYRWVTILFNMGNPPLRLPDWDTVKKAQP